MGYDGKRIRYSKHPDHGSLAYEGEIGLIPRDAPAHERPKSISHAHVEEFLLSDPEDKATLEDVLELCCNGDGMLGAFEYEWIPQEQTWKVFCTWEEWAKVHPDNHREERLNVRLRLRGRNR